MRLPRDVSSKDLVAALKAFGYEVTRQTGSHIRLTTTQGGEHHLTVPDHANLRVGTLSSIVNDVASHLKLDRNTVIDKLFAH